MTYQPLNTDEGVFPNLLGRDPEAPKPLALLIGDIWVPIDQANLEYKVSDSSYLLENVALAAEPLTEDTYLVIARFTESFLVPDGSFQRYWNFYEIDTSGKVISSWSSSGINNWEDILKQDINLDQKSESALLPVLSTDTTGARLRRDEEGALYIDKDGNSETANVIEIRGGHRLDFTRRNGADYNVNVTPIAAEEQEDGSYLIAVKEVFQSFVGFGYTYESWAVYRVSSNGISLQAESIDKEISAYEKDYFNQDIDGDDSIGASTLLFAETDTTGARLIRAQNVVYVDADGDASTNQDRIAVTGFHEQSAGGTPGNDYYSTTALAAEAQTDGTYLIAVKNYYEIGIEKQKVVNYSILRTNEEGVLIEYAWWGGIKSWEPIFGQDLDQDGKTGLADLELSFLEGDEGNARVLMTADGSLYIQRDGNPSDLAPLEWNWPKLASATYTDGVNTYSLIQDEVLGIEQSSEGLVLATRNTTFFNGAPSITVDFWPIASNGRIDYTHSPQRTDWKQPTNELETLFNQDLDGDGDIGVSSFEEIASATDGAILARDGNRLYIDTTAVPAVSSNQLPAPIRYSDTDVAINLEFDYTLNLPFGIIRQQREAAGLIQTEVGYAIVFRSATTVESKKDIAWELVSVNEDGIIIGGGVFYQNLPDLLTVYPEFRETIEVDEDEANESIGVYTDLALSWNNGTYSAEDSPVRVLSSAKLDEATLDQAELDLSTPLVSLSNLIDFEISPEDDFIPGSIYSVGIKLDRYASDLRYIKQRQDGSFYDFAYNEVSGEGAVFSKSDPALPYDDIITLYIRDNGDHDLDDRLGIIRDPAFIASSPRVAEENLKPTVSLALAISSAPEDGSGNIVYIFTRTGSTAKSLTVKFTVGGTAALEGSSKNPADYTFRRGKSISKRSLTFEAGSNTATLVVDPIADNREETNETVALTLTAGTGYTIGTLSAVTGTIVNDEIIGNSSRDVLSGSAKAEFIDGMGDKDTLTGGAGPDTFAFRFGDSNLTAPDLITDFQFGSDFIDLFSSSGAALKLPRAFSRAADNSTAATLDRLSADVFTDANGAIPGNQPLRANAAALVVASNSAIAGTYLLINDSKTFLSLTSDLMVNITGFSETLPDVGSITPSSVFL